MAFGRREAMQAEMWMAATDLPRSPGHVFYTKLLKLDFQIADRGAP